MSCPTGIIFDGDDKISNYHTLFLWIIDQIYDLRDFIDGKFFSLTNEIFSKRTRPDPKEKIGNMSGPYNLILKKAQDSFRWPASCKT